MAWSNVGHVATSTRKRILRRDKCCQLCGDSQGPFEVDHRNNTRGPEYNTDENLQLLCRICHERKTRRETAIGYAKYTNRAKYRPEDHPGLVLPSRRGGPHIAR